MFEKIKKYLRKKKFEYKRRKFCTEWNRRNRKCVNVVTNVECLKEICVGG